MLTIEEQERQAYASGNTALAAALARVIDLENEACELRAAATDAELTIEHLKRVLSDALNDDCWRERAAAAIE
jgi:phage shock protein A